MRRTYPACAILALLLGIAGAAFAAERSFPLIRCRLEVPKGWTVEEDEGSSTVSLTAPDGEALMMLTGLNRPGRSVREIAEEMAQTLGAGAPEAVGGGYRFAFRDEDDIGCRGMVMGDDTFVSMITLIGENGDFERMVRSIRGLD